jgi:Caspase domain
MAWSGFRSVALYASLLSGLSAPAGLQAQEIGGGKIRALLVGAADYSDAINKDGLADLEGAGNDVFLMADTLKGRGAKASDILIVTDASPRRGWSARARPTLSEVRSAFAALAEAAQPGDQVIVQMSGHGMQQPESVPGNEPDGLDEVFLPLDARFKTGPGARQMGVAILQGVLTDDEIGQALAAIRAKGADVVFLADFCHSGDSTRGATKASRAADMKLRTDLQPRGHQSSQTIGQNQPKGAYVGFFAAPSPVLASENQAPFWLEDAPRHGVLSAYTAIALRDQSLSTWLDVARRVEAFVVQHNGTVVATDVAPPPQFEGDLASAVLAGSGQSSSDKDKGRNERTWSLTVPATNEYPPLPIRRLTLSAGALDGIREGALLSLSVPMRNGREKVLLYGKATQVRTTSLELVPADGPRTPASAWTTPTDANGDPLTLETRFLVRLVRQGQDLGYGVFIANAQDKSLARLSRVISNLDFAGLGVAKAKSPDQAQLRLRLAEGKLHFDAPGAPNGQGFGTIALASLPTVPSGQSLRIRSAIEAAARFHRLRSLLVEMAAGPVGALPDEAPVKPRIEYFLWRSGTPLTAGSACPLPANYADGEPIPEGAIPFAQLGASAADVPRLQRCDVVLTRITNVEATPIDVTALVFKPDGAIEPLEIQDARRVRLEPGRVGTTGYVLDSAQDIQDLRDDLVLIAVRAKSGAGGPEGVPTDFSFLCQPSVLEAGSEKAAQFIDRTGCGSQRRKRDATLRNPMEVALGDLFEAASSGNTRGAEAAPVTGQTAIIRFSWLQSAASGPATPGATDAPR